MATAASTADRPTGQATRQTSGIEALLKRSRRWRLTQELQERPAEDPPDLVAPPPIPGGIAQAIRRAGPYLISSLASMGVHLTALLIAAWIALDATTKPTPVSLVVATFDSSPQDEPTVFLPVEELAEPGEFDEELPLQTVVVEIDPGAMQGGTPEVKLLDIEGLPTARPSESVGLTDDRGNGLGTFGDGEGGQAGGSSGEGGTEFFGVQASGNSFVFVCDCSRSMTGAKWMEVLAELNRCISELGPDKSFFVVFFDGDMHPMFEPARESGLLPATEENVAKLRFWLSGLSVGPHTSPYESVKFGLDLEPDAMFLLTDGEFSDYTAPYVRDFNRKQQSQGRKQIPVHTIGFHDKKHQAVLKRMARDTNGNYRFIDAPHVPRPKRRSWNVVSPGPVRIGPTFGPRPAPVAPRGDG